MATSLTTGYNLTRDQIIKASFEDVGIASMNEELEPEDIAKAAVALNGLAKRYMAKGMRLWKRGRYTLNNASTPALVAGTFKYELTPTLGTGTEKPLRITECNRKTTADGNEVGMTKMSLQEYEQLPNKSSQSTPVNYYFEPQRTTSYLYVWPAPDSTFVSDNSIEIIYEQEIQDMDVGNEDVDFPNEWYDALTLNLAYRLSHKYGTLSYEERVLLRKDAKEALEDVDGWDTEDASVYFQPNFD